MKNTKESAVKRDLRTPKYRMRVVEDKTKKDVLTFDELADLEDEAVCDHGFLTGCPYCKAKET